LDVEYMTRSSFWFDLKIIALTVGKVVRCESVAH
jgi:lipopolysaccharide/colanic/teichoic acid biosynthesis glycosyltransferase